VPAIQNLLPSIGFEKMKNKYALSAQIVLLAFVCLGSGYLLWVPVRADAQTAEKPGLERRVSDLEDRLDESEKTIDALLFAVAVLQFDLELCCGNGGGGGDDNGGGDGGGDCEGELITWYRDADSDGFGNPNDFIRVCEGVQPEGYVLNSLDCNDSDANVNPNASEIFNGKDDNCNGMIDEGFDL
jgi:hypothetical protein